MEPLAPLKPQRLNRATSFGQLHPYMPGQSGMPGAPYTKGRLPSSIAVPGTSSRVGSAQPDCGARQRKCSSTGSGNHSGRSRAQVLDASSEVGEHLALVSAALRSRHPKCLEVALQEASGVRYLRALSVLRRSSSMPAMCRHELECAVATRLVRARTVLGDWKGGVRKISEVRQLGDADRLREALTRWHFAEDEPEVAGAYADLARWEASGPEALPPAVPSTQRAVPSMQRGPVEKDGHGTRRRSKRASVASGVAPVQKFSADKKSRAESSAPKVGKCSDVSEESSMRRQAQLCALRSASGCGSGSERRPDGSLLEEAVSAWEFEAEHEDVVAASRLLEEYRTLVHSLQQWLVEEPPRIAELRGAVEGWPFANNPPCLDEARHILAAHGDAAPGPRLDCNSTPSGCAEAEARRDTDSLLGFESDGQAAEVTDGGRTREDNSTCREEAVRSTAVASDAALDAEAGGPDGQGGQPYTAEPSCSDGFEADDDPPDANTAAVAQTPAASDRPDAAGTAQAESGAAAPSPRGLPASAEAGEGSEPDEEFEDGFEPEDEASFEPGSEEGSPKAPGEGGGPGDAEGYPSDEEGEYGAAEEGDFESADGASNAEGTDDEAGFEPDGPGAAAAPADQNADEAVYDEGFEREHVDDLAGKGDGGVEPEDEFEDSFEPDDTAEAPAAAMDGDGSYDFDSDDDAVET
mmetsp:Transcript_77497/g.240610  ORF Transcript_77497/g.240610 Transcript_77497/m.240610 type:complete len:695 (-) Transcript_77497:188-2272(-)